MPTSMPTELPWVTISLAVISGIVTVVTAFLGAFFLLYPRVSEAWEKMKNLTNAADQKAREAKTIAQSNETQIGNVSRSIDSLNAQVTDVAKSMPAPFQQINLNPEPPKEGG